jgi:hypothetical protein
MDVALLPIGTWAKVIEQVVEDPQCWDDADCKTFVITLLLRNAGESRDESAFQKWALELETRAASDSTVLPALVYEKCLWARDGLDFAALARLVGTLQGTDPMWQLRSASLYCDLGDFHTARQQVESALADARGLFLRDRNSLWALSRLAWAQFCARQLREWNEPDGSASDTETLRPTLNETKCDPWDTFTDLDSELQSSLQKLGDALQTIEPQFDAGAYRDHSRSIRIGFSIGLVNYTMDRVSDSIGIPLRTRNTVVLSQRMEQGDQLIDHEDDADFLRLLRIIHADGNKALERNFGRVQVANLPSTRVRFLKDTLTRALDYALPQLTRREGWPDQFWSRRVAASTETLSRLLVRAEPTEALEWLHRGLAFAKEPRWQSHELFEALGHLIERSLSAVPPSQTPQILADVMSFPLPSETTLVAHWLNHWPDSSLWIENSLLKRPEADMRFRDRVAVMIGLVRSAQAETRGRAALWLARLFMKAALTVDEGTQFGDALWSRRTSEVELPSETTLSSHMFVLLPSPDPQRARELFKLRDHEQSSSDYLNALAGATALLSDGTRFQLFDSTEALDKLYRLLEWRPKPEPPLDLGQMATENKLARQALGAAIADAILPALRADDLTAELAQRIFSLEAIIPTVVQSYPELLRLRPSEEERAVQGILRAMVSHDTGSAWSGFNALYRWIRSMQLGALSPIPRRLVESTISIIETRREPGLLHALNIARLLVDGLLVEASDRDRLANALGLIAIDSAYNSSPNGRVITVTTLTLVRASVVRLANSLRACGVTNPDVDAWLSAALTDPMPEVRFAAATPFE